MLFSPPLHLHLRFVPTIPDLRIFNRTQVRSLPCLVFPSLTNCLRLDRYDPGLWRFRQPFLALPAVVSFDSYVVGIGTKQKPCCWWCQELIWPIFSPLKDHFNMDFFHHFFGLNFTPSGESYGFKKVIWPNLPAISDHLLRKNISGQFFLPMILSVHFWNIS